MTGPVNPEPFVPAPFSFEACQRQSGLQSHRSGMNIKRVTAQVLGCRISRLGFSNFGAWGLPCRTWGVELQLRYCWVMWGVAGWEVVRSRSRRHNPDHDKTRVRH